MTNQPNPTDEPRAKTSLPASVGFRGASDQEELRHKIHESIAACNRRFDKTGRYEADIMLDQIMREVHAHMKATIDDLEALARKYHEQYPDADYNDFVGLIAGYRAAKWLPKEEQ